MCCPIADNLTLTQVLLLSNVIINESLPIFLDSAVHNFSRHKFSHCSLFGSQIGGGFAAVALSTAAIGKSLSHSA
jgi:hypothetical protein